MYRLSRPLFYRTSLTFLLLLCVSGTLFSINKLRVALFDVRPVQTSEVYANKLYSELRNALLGSRKLIIVSGQKEDLLKKLEEWKKSGCTEVECLTNAGLELNVDKVLSCELREMPGGYYELDVVVIDVLSGEIDFVISSMREESVSKFNNLAIKVVDAIEAKIDIQPIIHAVTGDGRVIIDAGADLGVQKGKRFRVERWSNNQKDSQGKTVFVERETIGEIEVEEVQATGARARILNQMVPIEVGDKAIASQSGRVLVDEFPSIVHSPVEASVQGRPITITANAIDDKGISSMVLFYKNIGENGFRSLEMRLIGKDKFSTEIPAEEIRTSETQYYLVATDNASQLTEKKDLAGKPYIISIVKDEEPPEIQHTALTQVNVSERVAVRAQVTDNVRLKQVLVYYRGNSQQAFVAAAMVWQGGSSYAVELPAEVTKENSEVLYYLEARDQAGNKKEWSSQKKPRSIVVVKTDILGPQISHVSVKSIREKEKLVLSAEISDETGVAEVTAWYRTEFELAYQKRPMQAQQEGRFTVTIPASSLWEAGRISYFLSAKDRLGNESRLASSDQPFVVVVAKKIVVAARGVDKEAPSVRHFPPRYFKKGLGYPFLVNADDRVGIGNVIVYYRLDGKQNEYRRIELRKGAGGTYGEWISANEEGFQYYFACFDVNQNVTQVADADDPIIVKSGEIVRGEWQYSKGLYERIEPPTIRFAAPLELRNLNALQGWSQRVLQVKIQSDEPELRAIGYVSSERTIERIRIDTTDVEPMPVPPSEIGNLPFSLENLKKFEFSIDPPPVDREFRILAYDIGGKSTSATIRITRKESPVISSLRIRQKGTIMIVSPAIPRGTDRIQMSGVSGSLDIHGQIEGFSEVKKLTLNGKEIQATRGSLEHQKGVHNFTASVRVREGENDFTLVGFGPDDETTERKFVVEVLQTLALPVDNSKPDINITSPHKNEVVLDAHLVVRAKVTDDRKLENISLRTTKEKWKKYLVSIQDKQTVMLQDTIMLQPGKNTVEVLATDGVNTTTQSVDVFYRKVVIKPSIFVISPAESISYSPTVDLRFTVNNLGDNYPVRVMINGVIVGDDLTRGIKPVSKATSITEFSQAYPLKPGKNSISILAGADEASDSITISVYSLDELLVKGRYYALLIAVQDYDDPIINDLQEPVKDARRLRQVLESEYSFDKKNIYEIINPDRKTIIKTFSDLSKTVQEYDNLLVFYSGHGFWDEKLQQGYWLSSNANWDNRAEWISNADIRDYIKGVNSKHTLLITDACFGGGIFVARSVGLRASSSIRQLYADKSRKAMTSGNLSVVPDRSVFIDYLIQRLQENPDKYFPAGNLYYKLREPVMNNSKVMQQPQYGVIREASDEGGEFIFVRH